jgi:hypothetical protein
LGGFMKGIEKDGLIHTLNPFLLFCFEKAIFIGSNC